MYLNGPGKKKHIARLERANVPPELIGFYRSHDGGFFGQGVDEDFLGPDKKRYRLKILPAGKVKNKIAHGYIYEGDPNYESAQNWFVFLDYCDGNVVAVNANQDGFGEILDCFHETCGSRDGVKVIAKNFREFFSKLSKERSVFWL